MRIPYQTTQLRPSICSCTMSSLSYCKDRPVRIKASASLVPCNLAVFQILEEGSLAYGVINRDLVSITCVSADDTVAESETVSFSDSDKDSSYRTLTSVEWCRLKSSRVLLVLTSYRGFKLLNWNGCDTVYENIFDSRRGSYEQRFSKAVTSVDNVVCVGTSEGDIVVLYVPPTGTEVVFSRQLQGHSAPITALCTCNINQVASSDESGMIIVWSNPVISAESRLVINEPGGFPCLCLRHWRSVLVAAFSNGVIRLYSVDNGQKMVEIAAHGRCINAIDVAENTGLLLSVSEDCTACVWRLPSDGNPKVSQLYCVHVADSVLCGGRFCDAEGDRFALTAFDSQTVLTFRQQPTAT